MIDEIEIQDALMRRFKGRVALIAAAGLGIGFLLGALLF